MPLSPGLRRHRFLCAAAYVAVFLPLASVLHGHWGFPLDDSWIHQVMARNLAQTHHLGFIPGQFTTGSTSLLWSFLLALYWCVLPGVSPVLLALCTSAALLAGIGYTLKALTEEDGLPPTFSWCFALAPLASGNFLWFGLIGMEHLLFLLLALCLVRCWFHVERGRGDLFALALCCFLLTATRPEGVFLCLFLLLGMRLARRNLQAALAAVAGALVGLSLSSAVNWTAGHHLSPQTMQGRQFLYGVSPQAQLSVRLQFFGQVIARLLKTWSFSAPRSYLHQNGLWLGVPLVLALTLLAVLGLRSLLAMKARRLLWLCAWAALLILLYAVMLPSPGHGGRYLALPILLFLPLAFLGLHQLLLGLPLLRQRAWPIVFGVALLSAVWSTYLWRQATAAQIEQIETEHGAMATWVQSTLPPSAIAQNQVAIFDIGRIGYQLGGHLVDLGGLVDPHYFDDLSHGRIVDYLYRHKVQYVVLPSEANENGADWMQRLGLAGNPRVRLVLLHSACTTQQIDELAENSASTAYPCQRAYRLIYNDEPSH